MKPRVSLIPLRAILAVAEVYTQAEQAGKYGGHDWRAGRSWSETFDALVRHAVAHQNGKDLDESGHPHAIHCAARALQLGEWMLTGTGEDDRYKLAIPRRTAGDISFQM